MRQRFLPFRKSDIVEMCSSDGRLAEADRRGFREVCTLLENLLHYEWHQRLDALKDAYAPFNPDADTQAIRSYSEQEKAALQRQLVGGLTEILNAANFEPVTSDDLNRALREESLFRIRLYVDFDDFEEVLFFRRGESTRRESLVQWFGLRKREIEFTNYDRVVIYVKFKDRSYFESKGRHDLFFVPGSTLVKMFQNVPRSDLEMLFPNTEVRMKPIDKLMIGLPATASGIVIIATKLGATLLLIGSLFAFWLGLRQEAVHVDQTALVTLGAGLFAVAGYLWRQFGKFKNRKIRFMKALSDNLYFKNLDNNEGVFHHVLGAAEDEESKEAILAYYFLLLEPRGMTQEELDARVERWLRDRWGCPSDFEVSDAVAKLQRFHLVRQVEKRLHGLPLDEARRKLDEQWDGLFVPE
jgi:hypothetical protein